MGQFPVHGKNTYYERQRRKNATDQRDEDQQQTEKGLTISNVECAITNIYTSSLAKNHEFGTASGFEMVKKFTPMSVST
jgi:hypothetical protein